MSEDHTRSGALVAPRKWLAWWGEAWRGDTVASDLPMQGEHRVARSRVLLIASLTLVGFLVVFRDPSNEEYRRAIPVNLACLTAAIAVLLATRRGSRPRWLALATSIGDVSLVSLLHVSELLRSNPSMAVNGRITFTAYFLALVGTCVRWEKNLPLITGVVAAAQYAGIAIWGASIWPATATQDVVLYGTFDWGVQIERIATLVLFSAICGSIARWSVELRANATNDGLTGLFNRRTFEERLHDELIRSERRKEPVSVAMVDVDAFKDVNDIFGHDAGDVAIRTLAHCIRGSLRRTDIVARWGGDEFAIILPTASSSNAHGNVERMRGLVSERLIELPRGRRIRVTISAGIATAPTDGISAGALMILADERLLEAKRAGRNRVVSSDPSPASSTDVRLPSYSGSPAVGSTG